MSNLAISGSLSDYVPTSNVCEWMFSNPFRSDSEWSRNAQPAAGQDHVIPRVPLDKPLIVDSVSGTQLSWSRTKRDALRVAAGLHQLGLKVTPYTKPSSSTSMLLPSTLSSIVLLCLPNCLPYAPLLFGVLASGLTATMVNPGLTSLELKWILQNAKPEIIVTSRDGVSAMREAIEALDEYELKTRLSQVNRFFVVDIDHEDYGLAPSSLSPTLANTKNWKALLSPTPLQNPVQFTAEECASRIAVILWSSGTSGKSKGVLLSHRALTATLGSSWVCNTGYDDQQRWLGFVPFYHVFGLCNVLLLAPCCGATIFVMSKFHPQNMLTIAQDYRITLLHMAPPVAVLLAKSPLLDGYDLSSVKGALSGGAPLARELIELVYRRLGFMIKLGYGLSETAGVCNQTGYSWQDLENQHGSTGPPLWGVELKIVSIDSPSRTLNKGQEGEVLVRSPSVLNSYLNNEAATSESLDQDGWFHTGDVGKIDDNGFLWITDRLKEVIKVKGFQVSPSDLEGILCGSPLVGDAAVTSIYNAAQSTELPKAYVVPMDTDLLAQCAPGKTILTPGLARLAEEIRVLMEKKTAEYKWLRGNVVFVQQVPKSPAGKILRRLLKDTKGVEAILYAAKKHREVAKL